MRSTITSLAVAFGVDEAVAEAKDLYARWKANPTQRYVYRIYRLQVNSLYLDRRGLLSLVRNSWW